jgi:hypothetical protein
LQDQEALVTLLRREILHVLDMLDPAFGYIPEVSSGESDPALMTLLRERYRVVWDATIDGRLCREGLLGTGVRAARLAEFTSAFPALMEGAQTAFAEWFDGRQPRHAAIVAFIRERSATARAPAACA